MTEVNSNPKALVIMEKDHIGNTLRECFVKLERV